MRRSRRVAHRRIRRRSRQRRAAHPTRRWVIRTPLSLRQFPQLPRRPLPIIQIQPTQPRIRQPVRLRINRASSPTIHTEHKSGPLRRHICPLRQPRIRIRPRPRCRVQELIELEKLRHRWRQRARRIPHRVKSMQEVIHPPPRQRRPIAQPVIPRLGQSVRLRCQNEITRRDPGSPTPGDHEINYQPLHRSHQRRKGLPSHRPLDIRSRVAEHRAKRRRDAR